MDPVTVLLVGAGRFGANYVKVLSQINARGGSPRIGRLVLSRTSRHAAEVQAVQIKADPACSFNDVIGIQIRETEQLDAALRRYAPALTCITARDPEIGDAVHAMYAMPALKYGAVLCEKPFTPARGDDRSLAPAKALAAHPDACRFGLELPMAVVNRAMSDDPALDRLMADANTIDFIWQKQNDSADLINDLALHPWSLLPFDGMGKVVEVQVGIGRIDIHMRVSTPERSAEAMDCDIHLVSGGLFRGMRVDQRKFQICFEAGQVQLWEFSEPWRDVAAGWVDRKAARLVLAVDNPLRRHVEAMLSGKPLVDASRTLQSQHFLEACWGGLV